MWQNSSPTLSEMATDIDMAEICLKKMKDCCAMANAPSKLDSDLCSTIVVSDDCVEKLKKCEQFVDESLRLESYVKEQSKTKAMLLLIKYGNTDEFERSAKSAIEQLVKRNSNLSTYSEKLTTNLESASCICEKCDGTGTIEEQQIVRENGSQPSVIIKTSSCTVCEGSGQTNLNSNLTRNLGTFLDNLNILLRIVSRNAISTNNVISTSLREIQKKSSASL